MDKTGVTTWNQSFEKVMDGKALSVAEAYDAMCNVATGKVDSHKTAALLAGLRVRKENSDEIVGFATAMREKARTLKLLGKHSVLLDTCGTGGDGLSTINVSTMVALMMASVGVKVAKHGNRSVSSSCGSADVLEALNVKIDLEPKRMQECLDKVGVVFLFAPVFHPAMKHVVPVRRALATRTIFNLLGPLVNPAPVTHQLVGVFSKQVHLLVAQSLDQLGLKAFSVVHSEDGMDEISLAGLTKVIGKREGEKSLYQEWIDPRELGFETTIKELHEQIKIANISEAVEALQAVLSGKDKSHRRSLVVVNCAIALQLAGKTKTLKEGIPLAENILDEGMALNVLEKWKTF